MNKINQFRLDDCQRWAARWHHKKNSGYQTFILEDQLIYPDNTRDIGTMIAATHTHAYMRIRRVISTPISDWRFAMVTASPYYFILRHSWGETRLPFSVSRKTHFLGYPDGGEIKGVAETKGADKIKEGQRRDRRDSMLQPCNPRYSIEIEPPFLVRLSILSHTLQGIKKKIRCIRGNRIFHCLYQCRRITYATSTYL